MAGAGAPGLEAEEEMRRIIASVVLTLDECMEGPGGAGDLEWSTPFEQASWHPKGSVSAHYRPGR